MTHSNGVLWLSELTILTPSGKIYQLVEANHLDLDDCCRKCVLFNGDIEDDGCYLDNHPELSGTNCFGISDEWTVDVSYYYKRIM